MTDASTITSYFIAVILGILLIGLFFRLIRKKTNKLISLLPNIAVSLGILGTFVGIYIGLLEFDVSNIRDSIPQLLEGLKTAFATSIAGLITSIILKFAFEGQTVHDESKSEVQAEDPIDLLKAIVAGINNLEKSSEEIEKSIVSCFRSDEEYSLLSQLKLIRQEIIDTRREMSDSFKNFAEKIAESSTDALVKALEKVIADFNTLLNELVSESFKELSVAMIKLTEWQENYKKHVDETQEKVNTLLGQMTITNEILKESADSIAKIDDNLESIDSSVSGLSVSAEDISAHVENLRLQNDTLLEGLQSIQQIGEDAKTVIPTLEEHINNLTQKLEETVLNVTEKFEESTTLSKEFVEKATQDMQAVIEKYTASIQESIEIIDKGLEEELSKALNTLAGSLASLSAKFVEDYQPLTDRLREIVRLPEKIDA
ncbi:MotA/TolQ/ExbB proton channel family protein [candidate division KSB1 bacterium]|nr:MotA/TolQ/ExbB proton channel family protein [candidate division KSB1 bacterium]